MVDCVRPPIGRLRTRAEPARNPHARAILSKITASIVAVASKRKVSSAPPVARGSLHALAAGDKRSRFGAVAAHAPQSAGSAKKPTALRAMHRRMVLVLTGLSRRFSGLGVRTSVGPSGPPQALGEFPPTREPYAADDRPPRCVANLVGRRLLGASVAGTRVSSAEPSTDGHDPRRRGLPERLAVEVRSVMRRVRSP
jgi:hypothetical protein